MTVIVRFHRTYNYILETIHLLSSFTEYSLSLTLVCPLTNMYLLLKEWSWWSKCCKYYRRTLIYYKLQHAGLPRKKMTWHLGKIPHGSIMDKVLQPVHIVMTKTCLCPGTTRVIRTLIKIVSGTHSKIETNLHYQCAKHVCFIFQVDS